MTTGNVTFSHSQPPSVQCSSFTNLPAEAHQDLSVSEFRSISVSLDPPMSFRDRHRFLDEVYNSYLDPQHISAKDLVYIARQAGLCMEEAHAWFEDEFHRRSKLLAKFQGHLTIEPRPCSPESMSSYAPSQRTISATSGSSESLQLGTSYYSQTQSIFSGPSSPGTVSGDHLQVPSRVRRGRPPRTQSSSPPQPKRQKIDCQYPCVDCGQVFSANRWSEHVKRVHFPDYIVRTDANPHSTRSLASVIDTCFRSWNNARLSVVRLAKSMGSSADYDRSGNVPSHYANGNLSIERTTSLPTFYASIAVTSLRYFN